jgi:hypothetical protein
MADADAALYRAKKAGRAAFAIHGRDAVPAPGDGGTDRSERPRWSRAVAGYPSAPDQRDPLQDGAP